VTEAAMRLTEEEQRYLDCLARGMTFEEMAIELGMTVEEVEDFGTKFFDRAFEMRKRSIT
jgi:hypothetical protein